MANVDLRKWQEGKNYLCRKIDDNIAKERQRVLILPMTSCGLGHVQAVRYLDQGIN